MHRHPYYNYPLDLCSLKPCEQQTSRQMHWLPVELVEHISVDRLLAIGFPATCRSEPNQWIQCAGPQQLEWHQLLTIRGEPARHHTDLLENHLQPSALHPVP